MGKGGETLKRKQLQHRKAYFETKNTFGILKSKKDGKTINKICTISKTILISKYTKSLKALKGQRRVLCSDKRNSQSNSPIFWKWTKLMNKQFTGKEILLVFTQMKRYSTLFIKHAI